LTSSLGAGSCGGLPNGWTSPAAGAVKDDLKKLYPWMVNEAFYMKILLSSENHTSNQYIYF